MTVYLHWVVKIQVQLEKVKLVPHSYYSSRHFSPVPVHLVAIHLKLQWDLLFQIYVEDTECHACTRTEMPTDTNWHTFTHIHTQYDTQLLAHNMSQNASPRGQTADLASSAEFIWQLDIAHGAHKHTHTQTD